MSEMRKLLNQRCQRGYGKGSITSQLGKRGIQLIRK